MNVEPISMRDFKLTETERLIPAGIELLDRIMAGALIEADELPEPPDVLRKPPSTSQSGSLFGDF